MSERVTPLEVLLIEDDVSLSDMIRGFLEQEAIIVTQASDASQALSQLVGRCYDVVILDWMLPDVQGITLLPELRQRSAAPILMLTARYGDHNEILALQAGADDYMSKPVRPALLLARLLALTRRPSRASAPSIKVGALFLDQRRREVSLDGVKVHFSDAEYELVEALAVRAGEVISREELSLQLRGVSYDGLDRTVDIRVLRVRRKLEEVSCGGGALIKSVRGVGYMWLSEAKRS